MRRNRIVWLSLAVFGALTGCSSGEPAGTDDPFEPSHYQDVSLDHEVITRDGEKVLSVSLTNNGGVSYRVKISKVFYREYETQNELPVEFELPAGETLRREFTFLPEAWTARKSEMPNEVTIAYSGTSSNSDFVSDNTNPPSLTWSSNTVGPDSGLLFFDDSRRTLPRAVEVQITSIIENGIEQLSEPLALTVEPGARIQIPNLSRSKKPTVTFIARMLPNKRWSDPDTLQLE